MLRLSVSPYRLILIFPPLSVLAGWLIALSRGPGVFAVLRPGRPAPGPAGGLQREGGSLGLPGAAQ